MAIERNFVQEGVKEALISEYLVKHVERAGYGGMEINRTPMGTQITIYAEKPGMVIGKGGKLIRQLTQEIDDRADFDNPQIDVQEVPVPELNAQMMASRIANSLERGWYFRKAGHMSLQRVMGAGALGCEIVFSGKLTGSRSRVEKFIEGYIKHCGKPSEELVEDGFAIAKRKLGVIGVKVRIIPPGVELPDDFRMIRKEVEEEVEEEISVGLDEEAPEEERPKEPEEKEAEKIEDKTPEKKPSKEKKTVEDKTPEKKPSKEKETVEDKTPEKKPSKKKAVEEEKAETGAKPDDIAAEDATEPEKPDVDVQKVEETAEEETKVEEDSSKEDVNGDTKSG